MQKFRLVVLVGSRFDLLAKSMAKMKQALPSWSSIVVQVQRRERQSEKIRPGYAVVAVPPGEMTATEPTVLTLPRLSAGHCRKFALHLRCTEAQCQWRPESLRGGASERAAEDGACEIDQDDKENWGPSSNC